MAETTAHKRLHLPILQGLLPLDLKQIPAEVVAGLTLAALAIPEVMGYTKISGTPSLPDSIPCSSRRCCLPCLARHDTW